MLRVSLAESKMNVVYLSLACVVLGVSACSKSTEARPSGTLGGECIADRWCEDDLECFRGFCVPSEDPDAGRPRDAGAAGDGGVDVLTDAGGETRRDAGPDRPMPSVVRGEGTLRAFFATSDGAIVVDSRRAYVIDREGNELREFSTGRELDHASFDGEYLALADRSTLTTLTRTLEPVATAMLLERCASSVIVSRHRFVCGPERDWDRIFTTYDLVTGELLTESMPYTYNGTPMRVLPGSDHFVTVTTRLSPSDFHLYRVDEYDAAVYLGESPYHGGISARDVYTFVGTPVTHLVNDEGTLFEIFHEDCREDFSSFETGCFTRDGDLGALTGDERYLAMTRDAEGDVWGLAGASRWPSDDRGCEGGCTLHEVDAESRMRLFETRVSIPFDSVVAMEHDRFVDGVWLAVHEPPEDSWEDPTHYRIHRISLD